MYTLYYYIMCIDSPYLIRLILIYIFESGFVVCVFEIVSKKFIIHPCLKNSLLLTDTYSM